MTAHSHGKNSSVLTVEKPTYTDTVIYMITNEITNPTVIRFELSTLSGIGSMHKVVVDAANIIPRIRNVDFKLNQILVFTNLYQGDKYTIDVEAYSNGSEPLVRKYQYTLIAYPDKPRELKPDRFATETSLRMGFESSGLRHKWYIV